MEQWIEHNFGSLIIEEDKSPIQVQHASGFGEFPFFTSGDSVLKHNTAIIDGRNIFLATGGKANVKFHEGKAAYSTDTYVINSKNTDIKFLFYLLLSKIEFINSNLFTGSGLKHLQKTDLKRLRVSIPREKKEQEKIALILSEVDGVILKTEKKIAKYQRIKTGLMQDMLTKGIDENGNIRTKATHRFVIKNGIKIPDNWEVDSLSRFSNLHNNLRKPISAIERFDRKGIYPYYGATGIIDLINEFRIDGKFVLIGEDGDHFLKFETQEMTHLVDGKFNVSNHAHILSGRNGCLTEWIHYFYSHKDITFYLTRQGAGRFKLNKQSLNNLPISIPPEKEQVRIITFMKMFNQQFNGEKKLLSKLQSLKIGLMQDLLSGKVRVK